MFRFLLLPLVAASLLLAYAPASHGQSYASSSLVAASAADGTAGAGITPGRTPAAVSHPWLFHGIAIDANIGTMGIGFESATPLSEHLNLRAGGHFLNVNEALSDSGVNYTADAHFRSAEMSVDWFPWAKAFHISPGVLVYNGNNIAANAVIPGGDSFTLNGTSYVSSSTDPVHGAGSLRFAKAAPMVTAGWGNLLPRSGKHFSFPFEAGFAYVGQPTVQLSFAGTVCDSNGQGCEAIANDASAQANVAAEQARFRHDASYARFYPILSTGFSYRF